MAAMTPDKALALAQRYLADNRPWAQVAELLEDTQDFYVKEELAPGVREWPLGPGPLLIDKETGALRSEAWGSVFDQVAAMSPVEQPEL